MALPMTKSAMEALGKRLAKHSPPASGDIKSLQELLLSFDEPLATAVDLVRDRLGYEPNFRIKTTGVILDKLHRHGGSILNPCRISRECVSSVIAAVISKTR